MLNELSLEVIRKNIDYSQWATKQLRDYSLKYSRNDPFWSIYNGLANIFERYGESFETILVSERLTEVNPKIDALRAAESSSNRRGRTRNRVTAEASQLTN